MVGIGGHTPTGYLNSVIQTVGGGKFFGGNNDTAGTLRNDKPSPVN